MTGPVLGGFLALHGAEAVDDAVVIEKSWGDPAHFGVLFDKHALLIYRYIARRVGRQGSDNLVAETFVAAFGHLRSDDLRVPRHEDLASGYGGRSERTLRGAALMKLVVVANAWRATVSQAAGSVSGPG